jgi:integrase
MLPEAPPRHGFVETDELDRIPAELPPTLRPPVRFAAITGWRLASEVLTPRWSHVDLKHGVFGSV